MTVRGVKQLDAVPFGEALEVQRHALANGLRVLVLADPRSPVVSYHTWYRVGSSYERPGKTGLAHFFEHLMFNETKNLPHGEFDRRMEDAGADTNAATWIDWTYYHQALPAEELPLAIELEAERMSRLVLRRPQVESEREVVLNERRDAVDDDVRGAADERLHAMVFGEEHPHGWPTIGWMRDIEGYRVADCRAFYRTWYAPNNATLVIVGGVDTAEALRQVRSAYGRLRPADLPSRPRVRAPRARKERRAEMRWPTLTEKLCLGWPAPPYRSFEHAVAEVIRELWLGSRSARLRRRLIEEREIVSSLQGHVGGLIHEGLFDLWIAMREGYVSEQALELVDEEVARLAAGDVTEEELSRVKARAELFALSDIETASGKAYQIGYGDVVCGDPSHVFVRLEELRRVSVLDIARFARARLQTRRRARIHVRPGAAA